MSKHRTYVFTLNNYSTDDEQSVMDIECKYLIFGKEVGASGTPHLQGTISFKNPISFSSIKKKMPKAHIEVCKDVNASIEYCSKDGIIFEKGDRPRMGERTDIQAVKSMLKEGANMRKVVEYTESYQSIRHAEIHLKYFEKPRNFKPHVVWCHGATGTGKSRYAYEQCESHDTYTAMSTGKWFEGYDGHTHVIIDDMRRDFMKFHELLRLLDRYSMRVECKGGSRQFVATHIFITSCYSPHELFDTREDVKQLVRRIDEIKMFN